MRRTLAVFAAAAAALTAACSSGSHQPSTDPITWGATTTASPTPAADGGTFAAPEEIKAKLDAEDVQCAGLRPPAEPADDGVTRAGCTPDNGGSVFIAIYPAGSAALAAEVDAVSQTTFKQVSIVAGQNWTVSGPDAFVEDAAKVLGGTVTTSP